MLKPGGVLGIEDHRLPESADAAREKSSGYIKVSTIRKLAEQAGFIFEGASEVNANPKDKADYPERRVDAATRATRRRAISRDRRKRPHDAAVSGSEEISADTRRQKRRLDQAGRLFSVSRHSGR